MRTIKSLLTSRFSVELAQDEHGRYCVIWSTMMHDEQSEWLSDYATASYMFDLKIQDLEGN